MEIQRQTDTDTLAQLLAARSLAPVTEPGASERDSFTLRALADACFRHRVLFFSVAGSVLFVTLLAIALTPKRYQASMQLLVLNARQYAVVSSTDSTQPSSQLMPITDNDVNSQAELLRSHDVLGSALEHLGYAKAGPLARDKALEAVTHRLDVAPVRQSNVLNVTYVDSSPERAEQTLHAIADSFVAKELVLLRPTVGQPVFDSLVAQQTARLNDAQKRFADFKVKNNLASLTQEEAGLVQQVRETGAQADQLAAELRSEHQRATTAAEELGRHPDRIVTQSKSVPNQQAVQELSAKLVELQNKRTSLLTGYLPTDRFVQEVDTQIRTTRETLDALKRDNAAEQTTDVNPLHQELATDLARASINTEGLEAKRHALDSERKSYLAKLNALEQHGAAYDALQHEVAEAQQNLDNAVHKRDQAAVEDALDRDRIMNVAFAARPSADWLPIQPKPKLYLALGLFTALFFGLGSCAFAEMSRQTVYTPAELDALTGALTLAVIPVQDRPKRTSDPDKAPEPSAGAAKAGTKQEGRNSATPALEPSMARSATR